MKKIILMLLVLLCGMSLFAEVQEFGVGYFFSCNISSSNYVLFPSVPMFTGANLGKVLYEDICTYFSKIKPVDAEYFEVELYQCLGEFNGKYFTFLLKKGDKLNVNSVVFNDYALDDKSHTYEHVYLDCIIKDIRPNFIVIDFVKPTE